MDLKERIRELLKSFPVEQKVEPKDRKPLTIWIRPEEKMRYDILQAKSSREFSKLLQNIVRETINSVDTP